MSLRTMLILLLNLNAVGRPHYDSKTWRILGQMRSIHGTPRQTRGFLLIQKTARLIGAQLLYHYTLLYWSSVVLLCYRDFIIETSSGCSPAAFLAAAASFSMKSLSGVFTSERVYSLPSCPYLHSPRL